jgi:GH43 family beta-xylosidase
MSGETFYTKAKGDTPQAAFNAAREQAQYDYGHAGYTGTIAEKHEFILIPLPTMYDEHTGEELDPGETAERYAHQLINNGDPRIDDKWGPAGCFQIDANTFVFFGWASS